MHTLCTAILLFSPVIKQKFSLSRTAVNVKRNCDREPQLKQTQPLKLHVSLVFPEKWQDGS
jgi:hypothetical protein